MNLSDIGVRVPDASHGVRRAALTLHAMAAPDREWLLAQLGPTQSEPLKELLEELGSLGIPADPALLPDVSVEDASPLAKLSGAAAQDMVALLRDEPAGLIVWVLRANAWAWQAELLAQLPLIKRRQVLDAQAGSGETAGQNGGRLTETLLSELACRLPTRSVPAVSRGGLTLHNLRRWFSERRKAPGRTRR